MTKNQIDLLIRAIGAIENPDDLADYEIQELLMDLQYEVDIQREENEKSQRD